MSVTTFDVSVPIERVFAFLSDPRNLVPTGAETRVVEQSDTPLGAGSWFVLAIHQARIRVEYTAVDQPHRIAAVISAVGPGSHGAVSTQAFRLSELDGVTGTRIEVTAEGRGGWLRWRPLVRFWTTRIWRRMRREIEASA